MTTLSISQYALNSSHKVISVMATLQLWMERYEQRKQLNLLSNAQLNDMGLSRKAVKAETSLPFWK